MNVTGIVRHIDDLGRIVIPKELRQTMQIKEGDSFELFTTREGCIVLRKYSPESADSSILSNNKPLEERRTVCVIGNDNDHYYYNLNESQIKFLQALNDDYFIDRYHFVTDCITTP